MLSRIVLLGLGNPGRRYRWTRHNLGFHVLDAFAAKRKLTWSHGGRTYEGAECDLGTAEVTLIKPGTYVNLVGEVVRELRGTTEIEPAEFLAIADDIALPLGQLRLRRRGSDGGHNGLRAIADELQTTDFPRLRMGVGPVPPDTEPADFVLSRFSDEEMNIAEKLVVRARDCLEDVISGDFDGVMSRYNAPLTDLESD